MKCSNVFLQQAKRLSQCTSNPERIYKLMRHTMNDTIKLLKAINVLDMMRGMNNRGLVLPRVMDQTRNMCKGMRYGGGEKPRIMAQQLMKWKQTDSWRVLREQKERSTKVWRDSEKILREHQVSERYSRIWENEKKSPF